MQLQITKTNEAMHQKFIKLKEKNYKLYTLTVKFKYSQRLFVKRKMNTDLVYNQVSWLFGRISRDLFYKSQNLDMLWWGGPHFNKSDKISGVHAHFTIAIAEHKVRSKYRQKFALFNFFNSQKDNYVNSAITSDNLLSGFWLGEWDGNIANIIYNTQDVVDLHDLWLLKTKQS